MRLQAPGLNGLKSDGSPDLDHGLTRVTLPKEGG